MTRLLEQLRSLGSRPIEQSCIRCGRSPDVVMSARGPGVSLCGDCITALRSGEFAQRATAGEEEALCSFCHRSSGKAGPLFRGNHGVICEGCLAFSLEVLGG